MKILALLIILIQMCLIQTGCRTLNPETTDSSQPWAQPQKWEKNKGLPGISSSGPGSNYGSLDY